MNTDVVSFTAIVAALLVTLSDAPAVAQAPRVDRLEVLDVGFYTGRPTGKSTPAPGAATGADHEVVGANFLKSAPRDAAKIGAHFGVGFRSVGEPRRAEVMLRSVWKIPAPGITNPKTNNTYRESVVEFRHVIGSMFIRGYRFDETWEIVRGTWTLQIWDRDRKLLEENITIE